MSQSQAAINIPRSTLGKILQRRKSLIPGRSQERARTAQSRQVDATVIGWLSDVRKRDAPIYGPILKTKAKKFAEQLSEDKFTGSDGWFGRFKKRNQLSYKFLHGEAAEADQPAKDDWVTNWSKLYEGYDLSEIWNADKTGLYLRALPNRTIVMDKEENIYAGGKKAKERVTALFAVSLTREKKQPLIIGKSQKPRCFKEIGKLPVSYAANKNAWMTSALFCEWLLAWEIELQRKNKKILLLINNCSAHKHDVIKDKLQALKVVFLPPNITSILQPLDQGVIRSFKAHYRRKMVEWILNAMESEPSANACAISKKISLLDSILTVDQAWRAVKSDGIVNCWRKGELLFQATPKEDTPNDVEVDELILVGWSAADWTMMVDLDENLETRQGVTEEDVLNDVRRMYSSDNSDEHEADVGFQEENEEVTPSSRRDMLLEVQTLRKGLLFRNADQWPLLCKLDDAVEQTTKHEVKQSKIEQFFCAAQAKEQQ